ncbi:hypothetical protein PPYR_07513 [Photinus pyralis]|uniref:Uncharacterized protein n=2 Tax=Photinus pyralis TaxID=7054 RepID=A0A5N4AQT9_PHOPY|nr:general odorant-binding protein 19d-like [Photinus pyralis]KAB0799633.1 hypothetical protein PPYR_07513 [Photinus pyralis]
MKSLIILPFLLSAIFCLNPQMEEMIRTRVKENGLICMSKIGATDGDVAPLVNHQVPTTEAGKCFLACMYKTEGFIGADGSINREGSLAAIEPMKDMDQDYYLKVKQVMENCLDKISNGDNECETAVIVHQCVLAEKENVGLPAIEMD